MFNEGLIWWVTVIELPALAGLLALILKMRETLASEKLEAMRVFASVSAVREL